MSIQLYNYQKAHIQHINELFDKHRIVYDTSDVGSGKTYTALAYINQYNVLYEKIYNQFSLDLENLIKEFSMLNVYIICPLSLITKWTSLWNTYITDKHIQSHIMTYRKFLTYDVDDVYDQTILILDEGHILRNENKTSIKMQKLFKNENVNILLLSSTLLDKSEQETRFRMAFQMTDENIVRMSFETAIAVNTKIHYLINEEKDMQVITKGYDILRSLSYPSDEKEDDVVGRAISMAKLSKGLLNIHKGMVNSAVRLARRLMREHQNVKLIIVSPFICVMDAIAKEINQTVRTVVMNGSTTMEKRNVIIDKFNKPNYELTVLVTSYQVGSVGIDLDDKRGDINRHTIILPTYNAIDVYQMIGRTRRTNTRSVPYIHMLEAKDSYSFVLDRIKEKMTKLSDYSDKIIPNTIIHATVETEEGPMAKRTKSRRIN